MAERVLLLLPTTSYKADDFLAAAKRLGAEVVVGVERKQALADAAPGTSITVDFARPERTIAAIAALHAATPLQAIVAVDDETTSLAAVASAALGLRHNPPEAVGVARNKLQLRRRFAAAGLPGPWFEALAIDVSPEAAAATVRYPCVLKPLTLSASRGVLRADDPASFAAAFRRIAAILSGDDLPPDAIRDTLLVEAYLPGVEVALEGLLDTQGLTSLALFDKPDPLVGPTFEETIYVTPSRLTAETQAEIVDACARGCTALGLRHGPVHAEARIAEDGEVRLLELAPRTIGGLCSRTLRFGTGRSLEELVLAHALGRADAGWTREGAAAGVMMIPIPRHGRLQQVRGIYDAQRVPGVVEVTVSATLGEVVVPLPEGHRYLGFIFARAETPFAVEHALRAAHACLAFDIVETVER